MRTLKLFLVRYYAICSPDDVLIRYVLGYSPCHAVNLLYREQDRNQELNFYRHLSCEELPCINPSEFKRKK